MPHPHDAHEWLSLVDVSGPFLAVPVLEKAFPQGLEGLDPRKKKDQRQAYDEWREAQELNDERFADIHQAWINLVLEQTLELDDEVLRPRRDLPESLSYHQPEYSVTVQPDYAVVDDQEGDKPLMLISVYEQDVDLDSVLEGDGWATSPAERMGWLCRSSGTRLALVTNGERWMLIDAPDGGVTTYASWYARLWSQEPVTLQAFLALLGVGRFFDATDRQLPALFDESLKHQDEVTDALGDQVRRAVEVLVQALDRADVDRNRELLEGVDPSELYEAALTVMMRLVFLLSAEERELMDVVKDERFEANYAVSSLRMQLREQAGLHSEEILSHRRDAWSRLLAIFRAVYGGIEHETLRMPALGGSLFDPDRFPFLEGRAKETSWQADEAKPLPIDNRTVLLLLDAIQLFQGRTLSYRALDVENIGYVYEGLLERTVERAQEVILDLDATKSAKKPWVTLDEIETAHGDGLDAVEKLLKERTGSSINRVRNDLRKTVDPSDSAKLLTACHNDRELCDRIERYFHLLRIDDWGYPLVYPEGTFMVTTGADRRETGTHYTPKSLTEAIVKETLEPVVYDGPAQGTARDEWRLKSPGELLDIKICDPAMGSGAFLVQVCRWLSERLVESWEKEQAKGRFINVDGVVRDETDGLEALPKESEERMVMARRLIAERCLYGVDINPMAVELAKLSIWLVTLSKGRPFGFLDHNLRSGDSLLGIHDIEQLIQLHPEPVEGERLHAGLLDHRDTVRQVVEQVLSKRLEVRTHRIRDIGDVQEMSRLNDAAQEDLGVCHVIADAIMGEALASPASLREGLMALAVSAGECLNGDESGLPALRVSSRRQLATDSPSADGTRHPFHWALEFPEVFLRKRAGFDAVVGNPPFLGGQRITGAMGTAYRNYLVDFLAHGVRGSADLVAYFFLQAHRLIREGGEFGLLAVNTIAEGDTRQVGLERLVGEQGATIYAAYPNEAWPGKAAVVTSRVHVRKGGWEGTVSLNGSMVDQISAFLSDQDDWTPMRLAANAAKSFIGSLVNGSGFTLSHEDALGMIKDNSANKEVLFPYLSGKDVNATAEQKASRWVVNFFDWSEDEARKYTKPFQKILIDVKPSRWEKKPNGQYRLGKALRVRWWQYEKPRSALYHAIGRGSAFESHPDNWDSEEEPCDRVLLKVLTSKHHAFVFVENVFVFDQTNIVFNYSTNRDYAVLQSSIHQEWAIHHGASLETRPRYTPSDCFETFPFPYVIDSRELDHLGEAHHQARADVMRKESIGLTKFYNRFHDLNDTDGHLLNVRDLHRKIDEAIAMAYGWNDITLEHGFHELNHLPGTDRVRYTISEEARLEVLRRLSRLNKERYEEEVEKGLHAKKKPKKKAAAKKKATAKVYEIPEYQERELPKVAEPSQMDLLGDVPEPADRGAGNQWGNNPVDQILAWLEANSGWHAKQVILNGCQAEPGSWNGAIEELLKEGFVEADGDTSRYRAVP
ncbi:MAG: restriction endonuclease [Candidatus Thiodiazotropha taylori]|nr:ATP phosphoribosyltransferase regulatory subunit [Candidatus Thiodiazotropha taylori]